MELDFTSSGVSKTPRSPFHERTDRTQTAALFRRPEGGRGAPASRRQGASQRLGWFRITRVGEVSKGDDAVNQRQRPAVHRAGLQVFRAHRGSDSRAYEFSPPRKKRQVGSLIRQPKTGAYSTKTPRVTHRGSQASPRLRGSLQPPASALGAWYWLVCFNDHPP
jgi:hypothetical protein